MKKTDKKGADTEPEHPEHHEGLAKLTDVDEPVKPPGFGTRMRNYFLTGLIIVGPISITIYILWGFINIVDAWVKPLVPDAYNPDKYLPFAVPGAGLVFAVGGMIIIGALAANLFGRTIVGYGERVVGRMPVVRNVYKALKQIFETVLSQSNTSFKNVGLIEYPRKGLYAIVFIATDTSGEICDMLPDDARPVSVFLPTTPNPTSGFLLFIPRNEIKILDMSVEEGAKLVISAGLVTPPKKDELEELANARKNGNGKNGNGNGTILPGRPAKPKTAV